MFNVCKQSFLDSIRTLSGLNRFAFSMSSLKRGNSSSGDLVRMAVSDIREEQGDLFSAPPSTSLAHCVSSDLKMGAGIAVLFRKKFGCVEDLKNQNKSVGEVAHLEDGGRFIFYLITKPRFYDKPTEATLLRSLVELKDLCEEFRVRRLAMPRIGCGLDGLQWPVVYEMIKEVFAHCNMEVTIYSIPERKSMTPNLLRTQEKFRSFFDSKRPSSLPANAMASKRKLYSYPSDDEFDTPKKRLKTSSFDNTSYQRRNSLPHERKDSLGRRITQSVNLNRSVDKSDFWSPTPSKSKDFIPFISDEGTKGVRSSHGSKRLSYPPSDCDEESPATKKRKNREHDELYNRGDDSSQPRDGGRGENEKRTPRILESEDSDCDRKKHRKSSSSSKSKDRKSRGSSKSKERKSRDSCRGKERTSRSSSNSKERKSRSLSRGKERRSRDSGRSKERRSRDSSRSKERRSRDSSRSKERRSRDSSRSKERRSRDSSRSKERKLRDSIKSKEKKLRGSSRSRLSGSVGRECKHSNEKQANDLQYSDQSDNESVDSATCVSITTKETYQRSENSLEGLANVSARKFVTSSQQGSKSNIVTEYSVSYRVKKPKYPSLDISMTDKRVSKSASTGGLYSDRANTNSSVKSRLSISGKS